MARAAVRPDSAASGDGERKERTRPTPVSRGSTVTGAEDHRAAVRSAGPLTRIGSFQTTTDTARTHVPSAGRAWGVRPHAFRALSDNDACAVGQRPGGRAAADFECRPTRQSSHSRPMNLSTLHYVREFHPGHAHEKRNHEEEDHTPGARRHRCPGRRDVRRSDPSFRPGGRPQARADRRSPAAATGALSPTGVFPTGDYFFKNVETSRCVDDSQAYGLRAFTCNWSNYQKFQFWQKGNGYYRIANYATSRCIDDSDAYGLRGFGCNAGPYQEWNLYSDGVTTHLRNRATGRNLDDSYEFALRTFAPNDLSWQSFTFYRA